VKTKKLKKEQKREKKLLSLLENPCLSLPGTKKGLNKKKTKLSGSVFQAKVCMSLQLCSA